jgi:TolB-like protein/DNA-binding winged helix-turn-helix (wHTH) protein
VIHMAYEFQGFRLDADRRQLLTAGSAEPIHVSPKVLETLVYLVEHRGELVEKDALMKALWPRVVVEENSLDRNISTLRRLLGERPGENRFIATVPGRGYRFVAEVTVVAPGQRPAVAVLSAASAETPGGQSASIAPAANWHRFAPPVLGVVLVALVLAVTVTVVWTQLRQASDANAHQLEAATPGAAGAASTVPPASVAVIPLANLTGDPSLQYVGDGIATELIYSLSRIKGIKVPAFTSSFAYRSRDIDVREIGRELGVGTVLEGSLRSAGETLRLTVHLVDAHTGFHIWSQTYERMAPDLFELAAELANEVVQSLSPSLHAGISGVGSKRPTTNSEAYRLFLEGNALIGASETNLSRALALYDGALALDPNFARALAARATTRLVLVRQGWSPLASMEAAERDARLAIQLDPDVANAHAALGAVLFAQRQWLDAEATYQTALAKSGNDPMIFGDHTVLVAFTGRLRAALEEAEKAYRLAPLSAPAIMRRGMVYSIMEEDEAALRDATVGMSFGAPADAGGLAFLLAGAAHRAGRHVDAATHLDAFMSPDARAARGTAAVALAYEAAADPAKRMAAIEALHNLESKLLTDDAEQRSAPWLLMLYTMIGDLDAAYAVGNGALDGHDRSGWIGAEWFVIWLPSTRPFRQDPRFQAFVRRMKLIDYWMVYGPPDGCVLRHVEIACS